MKIWRILAVFLVIVTVFMPPPVESFETIKGEIDARGYDFSESGLLPLNGEWEFYSFEFIHPESFTNGSVVSSPTYITLPTDLRTIEIQGNTLPSNVYGTLRLRVQIDQLNEVLGLKSNYLTSSHKLWVNRELLVTTGEVGTTKEEYTAKYIPMETMFQSSGEELDIVIHVSNFHHRRVRLSTVYLGTASEIQSATYRGVMKDSILFGSLILIGLYHIILFFLQRKERVFLYFSCISIIVGMRVAIVNERLLIQVIPELPVEIMMKIGYLPTFILLPLLILYMKEIFQLEIINRYAKFSSYALVFLTIIILLTPVKFYDGLFEYGQWILFGCAGYIIFLLSTKEFLKQRSGSFVMILGGVIVLITAVLDTLRELDILSTPELLSTGVLAFILSQAFYLAWRNNDSFNKAVQLAQENEAMYEEIQDLNNDLEKKVELRTTELRLANNKLEKLSKMDSLTGLPNRRYFDEKLQEVWNQSIKDEEPLCVMMIDIDFFKGYNDFYGHLQGDNCLKEVAEQLQNQLKNESAFVARYGGEEFVVLLTNTDYPSAKQIAETMRQSIVKLNLKHGLSEISDFVTISIGVNSEVPLQGDKISKFIDRADQALYKAKENRRNSVYLYVVTETLKDPF